MNSKNVKSVERYPEHMTRLIKEHILDERLTALERIEWETAHEEELKEINRMLTSFALTAEANLQAPRSENSFSEVLHKMKLEKHYWKIVR